MPELLLEILSEEIPARMQARAAEDLKRLVCDGLQEAGLKFGHANAYVTPRRLVLVVDGLPQKQPDIKEERKGPKIDAPERAISGFLGSVGLQSVDACEQREIKGHTFYFMVIEKKGKDTAEVSGGIIASAMAKLSWPKSMRWGSYDTRWVRPLHGILCVFDTTALAVEFGGVKSSDTTVGHRFHAPSSFRVKDFADYKLKLEHNYVIVDQTERRRLIEEQAQRLASREKLRLKPDHGLLDEVTGLVEWPVVLMGAIDDEFMQLPPEVLGTAMRSHQKYFSLLNADDSLAPRFIVVANMETDNAGKAVIAGNQRVLRARLSDARFFWDQDCRQKLAERLTALKSRVFYKNLGSMMDKAERIANLAHEIAGYTDADADDAEHAARLCKADLSSEMVGEFPELQGIMGGYYAIKDGEDEDISAAISKHYAPQGPNDVCPTKPITVTVALADKIDTLVGFFAINEKPTGSKDPFALRRAALGVIRLIIENRLEMPLFNVFKKAHEIYADNVPSVSADVLAGELLAFFTGRLKVHLKENGMRHDLIAAVFDVGTPTEGGEDDLMRLLARLDALKDFLDSEDGDHLLVAYRRAANILRIEEKKDDKSYDGVANENLFEMDYERVLFDALAKASANSQKALKDERYADAMSALSCLRKPVDNFFDHVTVNCPDLELRANRLKLLSQIRSALGGIADFSKIEGT